MTARQQHFLRDWFPIVSSLVGLVFVLGATYGGYQSFIQSVDKAKKDTDAVNTRISALVEAPNGVIPRLQSDMALTLQRINQLDERTQRIEALLLKR